MKKRTSIEHVGWWKKVKNQRYIRILLYVLLAVVLYVSMLGNVIPDTYEVSLSSVAEEDIRSPVTVENKAETESKYQEALNSVDPVYVHKSDYAQNQVEKVNDVFELVEQVRTEEVLTIDGETVTDPQIEDQLSYIQEILSSGSNRGLSEESLETYLDATDSQLQIARETVKNAVYESMSRVIALDDISSARDEVAEKLALTSVNQRLYEAMLETARISITANYLYDDEATEELRQEMVQSIEPVLISEGQLIVKEGEIINHGVYEQLRLAGLLDDTFNSFPYIGLALFVLLIVGTLAYYFKEANTTLQNNNSHLLMYVLIFLVTVVVMKSISLLENLDIASLELIVPAAVGSMLITSLIHFRVGLMTSMMFALVASVIFNHGAVGTLNFTIGVYILFSCFAGAFFLGKDNRIVRILQAGLFVSLINIITITALHMMKGGFGSWFDYGTVISFAFISGFFAAVLTLGLMPFFETGFGILSRTKLIELSSPNHPLLRKILLEAPGTYHHSVMVANLADSACEAIGAHGLLARVGAYYHDIGKTRRPHFFIENQMKIDNPHNKISPQLSKTIIISHPYDGSKMLKEYKMPKEIIDIAEQHHGTSLLKYFYFKANEQSQQKVPESQFRYPGPKAQFKESAIVGIADCIEAAVRSMTKPTPDKIEQLVKKIIRERLEDGQFDECDLTLKELDLIAKSICETLQGTFHSRIEYPEEGKNKGKDKGGKE
ncbi:HD family phosphohydrolase [Bacillus sp. FJAT-44742]|uniref:HD family phosphohydrolase n=1 Tax=Bacillus sp. FJAT-44742 TaxID=2014005 RepID=UPI000C24C5D5|nr:HD family phosphohydrolase [Bacillus sp. FJAT-44742]